MLNDTEFVNQTLINNLYYLRTIREFCANIQLSFLENNKKYKDIALEFANKCEELGRILVKYVNGNFQDILKQEIFVTKYTLPCEELTEKLFDIKIATDITEKELQFVPGQNKIPTQEVVDELMEINKSSNILVKNFIEFCQEIYNNQKSNDLFSFNYPSLYRYMIEEARLFESVLGRLINKDNVDPTYVIDYQYWFTISMKDAAMFIRGFVDPDNQGVFVRANAFASEFDYLTEEYKNTVLSPNTQENLTDRTIRAVDTFRTFLSEIIEDVLNSKLYFIVEPIFLDNMYTSANFFKYILNLDKQKETT